jgi:hypothetical protein
MLPNWIFEHIKCKLSMNKQGTGYFEDVMTLETDP